MRNGWRTIVLGLVALLALEDRTAPIAEGREGGRAVRLTVEINWSTPGGKLPVESEPFDNSGESVDLEVSGGRIVNLIAWPGPSASTPGPTHRPDGSWVLGHGRAGRVRVRVEAPVSSSLILRAGGQALQFPIGMIVEGPQRSPPQSLMPVEVTVERVPWDTLAVSLGQGDGVAAPGTQVPVKVAFNILGPEPAEVSLHGTVELRPSRGGDVLWRQRVEQVVACNDPNPVPTTILVPVPLAEGTYVIEIRGSWEAPVAIEASTLIGRMISRSKKGLLGGPTISVVRRVTIAVLGDGPKPLPARFDFEPGHNHDQDVDVIDLTRARGYRPSASGRAPWVSSSRSAWVVPDEALAEPTRRDRLRGWMTRLGPEVAHLAPSNELGLAWSALGLKVGHPGRPHRLTLTLTGGNPSSLGVAVAGQGGSSGTQTRPRILLDACASGPPILPEGPPATFSWLVWPDVPDPLLVLVNRAPVESNGVGVQVGSVTLTELASLPGGPAIEEPAGSATRGFGLALSGPDALDRFGGTGEAGPGEPLGSARNLAQYLTFCGASTIVLPEAFSDRERRTALDGQAAEDATGPDKLELTLRVLARQGISSWLDLALTGPLPGLPAPDTAEALAKGLVRVDRKGRASGPVYHALNPDVQAAIKRRIVDAIARQKPYAKLAGVLVRLGPGPTLLGAPDTGLDDETFARFAREAFDRETAKNVPGLDGGHDDAERFAARSRFLAGPGRVPWLTWRSEQLAAFYGALAESTKQAMPGLALAVATPALGEGAVGSEARRADLAGLDPSLAWRAVGLDLDVWPTGANAPIVLRGVTLGSDDLANDLATSPELDAKVAARTSRGLLLDLDMADASAIRSRQFSSLCLTAQPIDPGPFGDEPLGHALAALDPRYVMLAAASLAGREERARRFSQVFRGLPTTTESAERPVQAFGVAVRSVRAGGQTYLSLANDTPYPIRLDTVLSTAPSARIYDISRAAILKPEADAAGHHLVLDLLPFGATAIRIGEPEARVAAVTPYPSESVLTEMQARYDDLSTKLSWLSRVADKDPNKEKNEATIRTSPPNPGFEPVSSRVVRMSANSPATWPMSTEPGGWQLAGGMGATLAIDPTEPHSGHGSLRLDVPSPPAAVASEEFAPEVQSALFVRTWLRSDRPDCRVRIWIEGKSAGTAFVRFSEVLAQPGWQERAVRVSDVPATGLESVRLRFEMLSAGSLWVDDLNVSTETLSEPDRRNARNALLAALQAYKEKRYADFARLAASRWTRHPGVMGVGNPELTRRGEPSALPPGRRLR